MDAKILGYAISNGGNSWRRAYNDEPLNMDETWQVAEPIPTPDFTAKQQAHVARKIAARTNYLLAVHLSKMSSADASAWIAANTGNVNDMRVVVQELGAMVLALCDLIAPEWKDNGTTAK